MVIAVFKTCAPREIRQVLSYVELDQDEEKVTHEVEDPSVSYGL